MLQMTDDKAYKIVFIFLQCMRLFFNLKRAITMYEAYKLRHIAYYMKCLYKVILIDTCLLALEEIP